MRAQPDDEGVAGARVMRRLDDLARFSDEVGALSRLYLSPAHAAAAARIADWMGEAGMTARLDAVGNVVGRYEAAGGGAPTLLIGSHIDTVRDAGRYDGNLGVVVGIEAVAALHARRERLPFAVEVIAFGDEEGVRFPVTLTGSSAVAGILDPALLDTRDEAGISIGEALAAFGCPPDPAGVARDPARTLGYLEVHIEQGPVLEDEELPVGVVTAINGATRLAVTVTGRAGHAGTVPMRLRRDALAAAAEMVLAAEARALATKGLVVTVGTIAALPGAVNVIPGEVHFTLDVRHASDPVRLEALALLAQEFESVARRRGVGLGVEKSYEAPAAACDPRLMAALEGAVRRAGILPLHLASGAGHDGLAMIALCPIAMLFVRCRGGISHHPDESITEADADVAVQVLLDALRHLDPAPAATQDIP